MKSSLALHNLLAVWPTQRDTILNYFDIIGCRYWAELVPEEHGRLLVRLYGLNQEVFAVSENGKIDMNEVTDCLEALSVFRSWKNLFLAIVIFSMAATQGAFWLVDLGLVKVDMEPGPVASLIADVNTADVSVDEKTQEGSSAGFFGITMDHLACVIRTANGIAILGTILYCLTLQFSVIVTIMGQLGGTRHVCRAFFLALVVLVLLLPWQHMFDSFALGLLYGPGELINRYLEKSDGTFHLVMYYLRFCGLWLLGFVFLVMSQFKCMRWAKSILRRLEII